LEVLRSFDLPADDVGNLVGVFHHQLLGVVFDFGLGARAGGCTAATGGGGVRTGKERKKQGDGDGPERN